MLILFGLGIAYVIYVFSTFVGGSGATGTFFWFSFPFLLVGGLIWTGPILKALGRRR
jgi:hypothetical protein